MGEFVECADSSPHGSESDDESPHSTLGGLNDDQGLKNFIFTSIIRIFNHNFRIRLVLNQGSFLFPVEKEHPESRTSFHPLEW